MSLAVPGKILLVDDTHANLAVLSAALEPEGYAILAAPDGTAALSVAAKANPDLILLDIMMPKLDGLEICRRLKRNENTRDIPVIFIPARGEVESLVEGFGVWAVEIWAVPPAGLGRILRQEPPGLCIGKVKLADGREVLGVLGESILCEGEKEITSFAG